MHATKLGFIRRLYNYVLLPRSIDDRSIFIFTYCTMSYMASNAVATKMQDVQEERGFRLLASVFQSPGHTHLAWAHDYAGFTRRGQELQAFECTSTTWYEINMEVRQPW